MEQRSCPGCGKQFTPGSWNQRWCEPRGYCARREWNEHFRTKRESATCLHCGEEFLRCPKERAASGRTNQGTAKKYCSLGCQYAARAEEYAERDDIGFKGLTQDELFERAITSWLAEPTQTERVRYRRSLKDDPCAYCSERPSNGIDHIEPTGKTGDRKDLDNMTGCCKRCNELKRTLPLLLALPWVPVSRRYHDDRRRLFHAA